MLSGDGYDFKVLFENKTVGIIIADSKGKIVETNNYACLLFGYLSSELRGLSVDQLVPNDIREKHKSHRANFNEKPRTRTMGAGVDLFGQRKDNSVFPLEISLSPFQKDGENYVTAFIMDATVRRENENRIKKQNEELEQIKTELELLNAELEKKVSDRTKILQETLYELEASRNDLTEALEKEKELGELKSRFVSMASHEFRTPLSIILSSAGLMDRYIDAGQPEKTKRHISRIKSAVDHLNAVLEDFLSLGKIEGAKIHLQLSHFNPVIEIQTLQAEMQEIAKPQQKILLEIENGFNTELKADKHILRNALINLISNAIKFSDEGKTIRLSICKKDDKVLIGVRDEGIGVPLEEQKHLFDRFFRASNVSNIQGTGLGLYIVTRYLEMIGSELSFESELGKGTQFTIHMPA